MYCSTQAGGDAVLEYCSWAQDIIFKRLTGKLDKGAEMSFI
jgi:hypothetical protein